MQTERFSGAECASVAQEAGFRALRRCVERGSDECLSITHADLAAAAAAIKPRITQDVLAFYESFRL